MNNSFLQNLLKIGVRIIHGRVLYTGKYGNVSLYSGQVHGVKFWALGFYYLIYISLLTLNL